MASPFFVVYRPVVPHPAPGKRSWLGRGVPLRRGRGIPGMDRICQKFGAKFSLLPKMSKMQNFYCIDKSNVV